MFTVNSVFKMNSRQTYRSRIQGASRFCCNKVYFLDFIKFLIDLILLENIAVFVDRDTVLLYNSGSHTRSSGPLTQNQQGRGEAEDCVWELLLQNNTFVYVFRVCCSFKVVLHLAPPPAHQPCSHWSAAAATVHVRLRVFQDQDGSLRVSVLRGKTVIHVLQYSVQQIIWWREEVHMSL